MDDFIRAALRQLADAGDVMIPGLGHLRIDEGADRKLLVPNLVTGETVEQVIAGRRRLRTRWEPALEAPDAADPEAAAGWAPVVRDALGELAREGKTHIAGLGAFELRRIAGGTNTVRNPFSGQTEQVTLPDRTEVRFERSAALDAVVRGQPIPAMVPPEELSGLEERYPIGDWTAEALVATLERSGRRRDSPRAVAEGAPPVFVELGRVARILPLHGSPELAKGDMDFEVGLREVLRDGNGDRWVADVATGQAYWLDHEAPPILDEPAPLDRLLAAWLFHQEVSALIEGRLLAPEDQARLWAHFEALCPVAAQRRSSFAPFPS
ncbi:MAG: hypothetical protein H6719_23425 [Sandaracinaceae bacterium]|nr:hypothetical protein [Sandaracinaceae bacterium]